MKYIAYVKGTIEVMSQIEVEADTEFEAERKVRCQIGITQGRYDFDQGVADEVLNDWRGQARDFSRDLDNRDLIEAEVRVEEDEEWEEETPCRDCGVPCSHEKDGDGFHKEE